MQVQAPAARAPELSEQQKAATTQAMRAAEKLVAQNEKELLTATDPQEIGEAAASILKQVLQSTPLPREAIGPLLMFVVSDIVSLGVERGVLKNDGEFVKEAASAASESFGSSGGEPAGLLE